MKIGFTLALAVVLTLPGGLAGQRQGPMHREALQEQIVRRFVQNFRTDAGLTDEQTERFIEVLERSFLERREIDRALRDLFRALEGQLRPGVAANPDSLTALLSEIRATRARQIALLNEYQDEFAAFLTPVQQGQLILSLERLQRQIETIIRRRGLDGPPGRPDR